METSYSTVAVVQWIELSPVFADADNDSVHDGLDCDSDDPKSRI